MSKSVQVQQYQKPICLFLKNQMSTPYDDVPPLSLSLPPRSPQATKPPTVPEVSECDEALKQGPWVVVRMGGWLRLFRVRQAGKEGEGRRESRQEGERERKKERSRFR